jgi:uncharacterized RDD family membrane protein YckC
MSYSANALSADYLTGGVLFRRVIAWLIDAVLIGLLVWVLWWVLALFGVITLGLGFGAMAILPAVPFLYNLLSLFSQASATPGQQIVGLTVRRSHDLGPPGPLQALVYVLLYYLTLATTGLLLLVALFTLGHRTLHDLLTGLVVVRTDAMEALTAPRGI